MQLMEQIEDRTCAKPILQKRMFLLNILPLFIFGLPTLVFGLLGYDESYLWILALATIPFTINLYLSIRDGFIFGPYGSISSRKKEPIEFWTDASIHVFLSLIFLAIAIMQEITKN